MLSDVGSGRGRGFCECSGRVSLSVLNISD